MDKVLKEPAEVVDIQEIDAEDQEFAPVIKAFNTYGFGALPIITLNGKPVCMATIYPSQITTVLEREIRKRTEAK